LNFVGVDVRKGWSAATKGLTRRAKSDPGPSLTNCAAPFFNEVPESGSFFGPRLPRYRQLRTQFVGQFEEIHAAVQ
jgi:hypothetical protein